MSLGTSRAKSQVRLLPSIIYRIELFEQSLMLSKTKTKGILDLTKYMDTGCSDFSRFVKRSTSRDFKIHDDIIEKAFKEVCRSSSIWSF